MLNFNIEDLNVQSSTNNSEFINSVAQSVENQILTNTNIISNINQLPKEVITPSLNMSFYDIALVLENCQNQLIYSLNQAGYLQDILDNKPTDQQLIDKIQSYIRRNFSNFCNNPNNLVDSKGNYIGLKYGLRILLVSNDGWVLQDVQTFCKDVKNAGPSFNGTNNNYISYTRTYIQTPSDNVYYNPSKISFKPYIVSYGLTVMKSSSTDLPTTLPTITPNLLNYVLIGQDGKPTVEVPPSSDSIIGNQIIDNHGTRYEIQISRLGLYGYASRRSDTTQTFNYYVCKNLGVPPFTLQGTEYTLRLSFFEW